jgi:hypothetical protein
MNNIYSRGVAVRPIRPYRCICRRPQEVPLYTRYVKLSREYAQITKRDCHCGGRFAYDPNVNCMIDEPVC